MKKHFYPETMMNDRRSNWKRSGLMLLLAALLLWLMSGCAEGRAAPVAVDGTMVGGALVGLLVFGFVVLVAWAFRKLRTWDVEAAEAYDGRPPDDGENDFALPRTFLPVAGFASPKGTDASFSEDPLAAPGVGMMREDDLLILRAAVNSVTRIECYVKWARASLSDDEREDQLKICWNEVLALKQCLQNLKVAHEERSLTA